MTKKPTAVVDESPTDQEAAEEEALLAGTLPDEDRRAPETTHPMTSDEVVAAFFDLQDSLIPGSRITKRDGRIEVYLGEGVNSHGVGKTYSRALLAMNSTRGPDKEGVMREFTQGGDVLPPE